MEISKMPFTMYNKKTGQNVKVYGFVQQAHGLYGSYSCTYAVTYQLDGASDTADDLKLKLVLAEDLRPLDI